MPSSRGMLKRARLASPSPLHRVRSGDPRHSGLCNGSALQSASRSEATADRRQDGRVEKRQVFQIVRTIQKDRGRGVEAQRTGPEMFPSSFRGHLVILSGWISIAGRRLQSGQGELGTPCPASVFPSFFSSQSRPALPAPFHAPRRKSCQSRRIRVRQAASERVPSSSETKAAGRRPRGPE